MWGVFTQHAPGPGFYPCTAKNKEKQNQSLGFSPSGLPAPGRAESESRVGDRWCFLTEFFLRHQERTHCVRSLGLCKPETWPHPCSPVRGWRSLHPALISNPGSEADPAERHIREGWGTEKGFAGQGTEKIELCPQISFPLQGLESCPISIGRNHEGKRKAENPEGMLKDFQGISWGLPGT